MSELTIKTQYQIDEFEIVTVASRRYTDLTLIHDQCYTVQNAAQALWDAAAVGAQPGFTLLILDSDQPVEVELVTENALLDRQVNSIPLGKELGLVLSADDARYDYGAGVGADSFTGTLGKVNLVRVNEVNDVPAKLRLRLFR